MKKHVLKVEDPDHFFDRCEFTFDVDADPARIISMTLEEGETPPRFPKFSYELVDE